MSMTINVENLEKFIRETSTKAAEKFAAATKIRDGYVAAGVDPTMDKDAFEKCDAAYKEHSVLADEIEQAKTKLASITQWGANAPAGDPQKPIQQPEKHQAGSQRLGAKASERYAASQVYQEAKSKGLFAQQSVKTELAPVRVLERSEIKTLVTGLSSTSGGAFVITDRQEELIDVLRRPRSISSLFTVLDTDSDLIDYVEMTSRTNNAAEALEATSGSDGAAAESAVAFAVRTITVEEVKHFIPATKRSLADVGQMAGILDAELVDGVLERLDSQLANGSGSTPDILGAYNKSGIQTFARGGENGPDAIHKAMTLIRLAYMEPDAVGVHPNDAQDLRLEKDANGTYLFGPPSQAGGNQIWGVDMAPSAAFTDGTPIVGAWKRTARLWIREGVTVTMTDSHDDWFVRGIVAMLASMRCASGFVRPTALCTVTGF